MTTDETAAPGDSKAGALPFDTSMAHQARMYDYLLGGKDNYAADRAATDAALKVWPDLAFAARANRAFLGRAVRYLAAEAGIRQFLDLGTGIPTAGNTHEVAQAIAPETRVVYVDYDPIVLAHARALLDSSEEGATEYIDADLRDTGSILDQAAQLLDFSKPVAVTCSRSCTRSRTPTTRTRSWPRCWTRCRPAATSPSLTRARTSSTRKRSRASATPGTAGSSSSSPSAAATR